MLRRVGQVLAGAVVVLAAVGFGLSRGGVGGFGDRPAVTCDAPVAWQQADELVGEMAAVAGPVAAASHQPDVGGSPAFLNLGNPHPDPDRFDVVIYEEVRERFEQPPEVAFAGEEVCVVGRVRDRDGVPQVVLDTPVRLQHR